MKKNKCCPKCQSDNIGVLKSDGTVRARIPVNGLYTARYDIYVCRECGYMEYFIKDKDLSKTEFMDDLNKKK